MGGYIAANRSIVDAVRSMRRNSSLPLPCPRRCARRREASIEHLKQSGDERGAQRQAQHAKDELRSLEPAGDGDLDHIVPLIVGDARQGGQRPAAQQYLYPADQLPDCAQGNRAAARPPTPLHTDAMIAALRDALVSVWAELEARASKPKAKITSDRLTTQDLTLPAIGG